MKRSIVVNVEALVCASIDLHGRLEEEDITKEELSEELMYWEIPEEHHDKVFKFIKMIYEA